MPLDRDEVEDVEPFLRMLLAELEFVYEYIGAVCLLNSRIQTGLRGDGETGVRGMGPGDRKDRAGRAVFVAAEMLRDNFGLAERAANILLCWNDFGFDEKIDIWSRYRNGNYVFL